MADSPWCLYAEPRLWRGLRQSVTDDRLSHGAVASKPCSPNHP